MEKQKNVVSRMQAYLDNFSKDNRKENIDRTDYKERMGKVGFEHINDKAFMKLLKKKGFGDLFRGTTGLGEIVTKMYEKYFKKDNKNTDIER